MRRILLFLVFVVVSSYVSGQDLTLKKSSDQQLKSIEKEEPLIKIYPVPVLSNNFTISSDTPFIYVRMTNIIGQEITRLRLSYPVFSKEIEFKTTEKGIYLITIELEDHRKIVRKILVDNGR
ncbi:MAG: T9SS type A sorting domain-containing protein [Marinilabiliaceae bacterium]|jgi:hypothetical protein|nr:T9SS type A sorting domain-containing protein [Marinilabiliaceae bacterium]